MRPFFLAPLTFLPMAATAQPSPPAWVELLGIDTILTRVIQSGIVAARSQADITYDHLAVTGGGQFYTLSGINIFPILDSGEDCLIGMDRVTISLEPWTSIEDISIKVDAIGTEFDLTCLPEEMQQGLAVLGQDILTLDHAVIDISYNVPSAGATLDFNATAQENAEISLGAVFDYVSFEEGDFGDPLPVVFLTEATLTASNLGAWEKVSPLFPEPVTTPAVVGPLISQQITQALLSASGESSLSQAEQNFVLSAGETATQFVSSPGQIVLELRPEEPQFLDFEAYEDSPRPLIADVVPLLSTAPSVLGSQVDPALLTAAMERSEMSTADTVTVARALLTGDGAPRNPRMARSMLRDITNELDGDTLLLLAENERTTNDAYLTAMQASLAGAEGAASLLTRLEGDMTVDNILGIQGSFTRDAGAEALGLRANVTDLRLLSLDYLMGNGDIPRSYVNAALLASLGASLGDPGARAIQAELEARFGHEDIWRRAMRDVDDRTLAIWTSPDFF